MSVDFDAPRGQIPKRGEAWLPVGRKACVGAFFVAPVERVRRLVPAELEIVEVLPGRTVASVFLGDYGPGSTLEFCELGVQPALVRCHTGWAMWSSLVLVDSEASYVGGEPLGFIKQMATFRWNEQRDRSGGVRGRCAVIQQGCTVLEIDYAQGRLPLPSLALRVATIADDMLFSSRHHLRGRYRLSRVRLDVGATDGPLALLGDLGAPLAGVVVTEMRGRMGDRVSASFLPHRNPQRATVPTERVPHPISIARG